VAVWGSQAGGLVAKGELLTIKDSMNSGEVAASNHSAGGLTAWADVLIISNSVNSGKVVALSGAGGLATGVTIQAQFENSLNNGEMVLLVGPTSSTALNELGTPAANPPLPTASMDGILATGPLTAVQSFTTAPSKRSSTSTVTQLTDPDTYLGWNMDSVWGFDCSESAPMPKLRSIYQGANPLRVTCEVAPAMNPVQQDETGYRGPAVDSNYSTSARATGSLEVTGTSLSFVSKVWVGSFSASISSVSSTSLQLLLPPNIPEGLYDLILESTFGTFKAVGAVRIVATAEETVSPLVGKTKQIRNFTPGQISISDKQRRQLIEMLSIGSAKRLVCTAVTSKVMRLRARLELRSQAQATCAAISVMMPAATIRVQSKPTLHRHMVGRVLVTITG
jgi:hypothetical protein